MDASHDHTPGAPMGYLGAYHFAGDPETLLAGYARLMARFPLDTLTFHACIVREKGITVLDACPSREVFDGFSRSPGFLGAIAAAGLPVPAVERLGAVHAAHLGAGVPA